MEHPPAPSHAAELHSHVLEHSLYQLLRTQHQKNIDPDQVGLSTAPVGISKRRRMAGPRYVYYKTFQLQSTLGFETLDKAAVLGLETATPLTDPRQYINSNLGFRNLKI